MDNATCILLGFLLSVTCVLVYFYGKSQAKPPVYISYNKRDTLLTDVLSKENIKLTSEQLKRISQRVTGYSTIGFEGKDADV